jgi:m7GpppX diphosphatase
MASEDKKPKLVSSDVNTGSTTTELSDLKDFQVHRVLSENSERKTICVEGRLGDDLENPAIVFLEKMPFIADKVSELLQSSTLRTEFKNDIYGKYECLPDPTLNSLKANLIYPATEKHIAKYSTASLYLVNETPALYETVTLPYIKSEKFNIDWVYNILSHEKESERIVYEDPDPVTGFILLPDSKWSCKQVEDLYLLAMVHAKDIKSLRDLTHRHLPLLKKLWNDGNKAILGIYCFKKIKAASNLVSHVSFCCVITEKYGVHQSQIRAYIHYQPSHYHFHVHFTHLQYNAPGEIFKKIPLPAISSFMILKFV